MSSLDVLSPDPTRFTTKVKAQATRPRTYLFGSDKVTAPFQSSLVLCFRVDSEGETTTFYSQRDDNSPEFELCTLERGEMFAVKLANLISVSAMAQRDTRVHCALVRDA